MSGSFTADLTRFLNRTNSNVDALVRKVVLDLGREVVERSPVGDANYWIHPAPPGYVGGKFRANWQHGVGEIPSPSDNSPSSSVGRAVGELSRGLVRGESAGKVHYIINQLPYSIAIENGRSRQAPQGIVGLAVFKFEYFIRQGMAGLR